MLRISLILLLVGVAFGGFEIPGGYKTIDVNDEGAVSAANTASKIINKEFSNQYHHILVKVLKARRQDLATTSYMLEILLGMTNCKKAEMSYDEARECDIQDKLSAYKKCTVLVFKETNGSYKLKSHGCILASRDEVLNFNL